MPHVNNRPTEKLNMPSRRRLFRGKVKTKQNMRLPWSISEAAFTSGCTQCQECINHCETNIIVKDEDGFPKIDFNLGECSFCDKCIDVCEQPLFKGSFSEASNNNQQNQQNQKNQKMDKPWPGAININDKCLAKNNIYCQSCRDECEINVIKFNYTSSSIPEPSIELSDCTQCGACIKVCPQDAITFIFDTSAPHASENSL